MREVTRNILPERPKAHHPGLLLNRYLDPRQPTAMAPIERRELLDAAMTASRSQPLRELYQLVFDRRRKLLEDGYETCELKTPPHNRLIVGLGQKGVLEAGLRLHHTYGTPILPGSALKGLTAHYCHEVWGAVDVQYQKGKAYHQLLFGTTEESGVIRFEDAWILPECLSEKKQNEGLLLDVMTPHHQNWLIDDKIAPTDFDSPIPVQYLSVAGQFHFALSWQGPEHADQKKWAKRAMKLLSRALKEWGIGGKTSSGYGRLIADEKPEPPAKEPEIPLRKFNEKTTVTIVGPSVKGGFKVKEPGRPEGTLEHGTRKPTTNTNIGSVIEVYIHRDDRRWPEYRWSKN
jgi:CRISPR-associated protein Cmr6